MAHARRVALIAGTVLLVGAAVAWATQSQWLPEIVNEGSTTKITLSITDLNGLPPPTTTPGVTSVKQISVWVTDAETGTVLATPAPVTPGTTVDITVGPSGNRIVTTTKDTEEHVVTGVAAYGASCTPSTLANCTSLTTEARFAVRNLGAVVVNATGGPSPAPTPPP